MTVDNSSDTKIQSPFVLALVSLAVSAAGCSALTGYTLWKLRHRVKALCYYLLSIVLFVVQCAGIYMLDLPWYDIIPIFAVYNLALGLVLPLAYMMDYRLYRKSGKHGKHTAGLKRLLAGIDTGGVLGFLLFILFAVILSIVFDYVFSTYVPVNPDQKTTLGFIALYSLYGLFIGMYTGGYIAYYQLDKGNFVLLKLVTGVVITVTSISLCHKLLFEIPYFQVALMAHTPTTLRYIVRGVLWSQVIFCIPALLTLVRSKSMFSYFCRCALILFLSVCLMLTSVINTGMLRYDYLALGKLFEQRIRIPLAMKFYEKSLMQYPDKRIQSYLKYRLGILYHKKEDLTAAQKAFQEVLSTYNDDRVLVRRASKFLEQYKESQTPARKVIPGIETATEFKASYCAPNSYALIYNYWGIFRSAKRLGRQFTWGDFGTLPLDAWYYSVNEGLSVYTLPLADRETVKRFIDAGIPVLVHIPRHILAVFGYDDLLDTFVAYDTATRRLWVDHPYEDFAKDWKKEFRELVIVIPPHMNAGIPADLMERMKKVSRAQFHYLVATQSSRTPVERYSQYEKSVETSSELFYIPIEYLSLHWSGLEPDISIIDMDEIIRRADTYLLDDFNNLHFIHLYCKFLEQTGRGNHIFSFLSEYEKKASLDHRVMAWQAMYQLRNKKESEALTRIDALHRTMHRKTEHFRKLIQAPLYYNAGLYLQKTKNYPGAFELYSRFLNSETNVFPELFPTGYFVRHASTEILALGKRTGDFRNTKKLVEQYLEDYPFDFEACHDFAEYLRQSDQKEDLKLAEKYLQRVLAISTDKQLLKQSLSLLKTIQSNTPGS